MLEQDARIGGFKAELIQKQDMHLATLQKDLERQSNYLDKMRSEVRHEIDKLTASQRLDLNLEKGCATQQGRSWAAAAAAAASPSGTAAVQKQLHCWQQQCMDSRQQQGQKQGTLKRVDWQRHSGCQLRDMRLVHLLARRRMRDDLQQMRDKTVELEIKMDRVRAAGSWQHAGHAAAGTQQLLHASRWQAMQAAFSLLQRALVCPCRRRRVCRR